VFNGTENAEQAGPTGIKDKRKMPWNRSLLLWIAIIAFLSVGLGCEGPKIIPARPSPSGGRVERVGNPLAGRWSRGPKVYARNIWDLQVFDGRLYIGCGNSSNTGPVPNAGPVPVWSFDPQTRRFVCETVLREEQIDKFCVIDRKLYIPGHDPAWPDSWEWGNFYRLEEKGWKKYRNIPGGLHAYDICRFNNKLFAALGTEEGGKVAISTDNGETWKNANAGDCRIYALFQLNGEWYAAGEFFSDTLKERIKNPNPSTLPRWRDGLFRYDREDAFEWLEDMGFSDVFPGVEKVDYGKVTRAVNYLGNLIYIGAGERNDHQSSPFGLFAMESLDNVQYLALPSQSTPWDLLARGGVLYVLLSSGLENQNPGTAIYVLGTRDLRNWTEVVRFRAETFARSFELLNGDLYFGLGDTVEDLEDESTWSFSPATGDILRVQHRYLKLP
jgi:hypothetical protein